MDDIPHADETRTLIKDIWDIRISKLRSSIDTFVKSEATHAKVGQKKSRKQIIKKKNSDTAFYYAAILFTFSP